MCIQVHTCVYLFKYVYLNMLMSDFTEMFTSIILENNWTFTQLHLAFPELKMTQADSSGAVLGPAEGYLAI